MQSSPQADLPFRLHLNNSFQRGQSLIEGWGMGAKVNDGAHVLLLCHSFRNVLQRGGSADFPMGRGAAQNPIKLAVLRQKLHCGPVDFPQAGIVGLGDGRKHHASMRLRKGSTTTIRCFLVCWQWRRAKCSSTSVFPAPVGAVRVNKPPSCFPACPQRSKSWFQY